MNGSSDFPRRAARRAFPGLAAAVLAGALAGWPAQDAQASRYGYGHGHHGGARVSVGVRFGGHGHRYRHRGGYRAGHGYRHGYRRGHHHRHRSSVSVFYSAPLVAYAPAPRVVYSEPVVVERRAARVLPSMPELDWEPLQGQDAHRTTVDRRRCESQAWRETRPAAGSGRVRTTTRTHVTHDTLRYRGDPFGSTVTGTALGAIGGGIAGDAGAGAAIGAIAGFGSWILGGGGYDVPVQRAVDVVEREYVPPPGPDPQDLHEAIVLCMQARGYGVR